MESPREPAPAPAWRNRPRLTFGLAAAIAAVTLLQLVGGASGAVTPSNSSSDVKASPTLLLNIGATPSAICADNTTSCSVGISQSRVVMQVEATAPIETWPAVQIAFVIETDAFDGVYDPTVYKLPPGGLDPCIKASSSGPPCEESNGVPFFETYASSIVDQIAADNPNSNVSFAMLDYQGTCDTWDDPCYAHALLHIDVPNFATADQFGPEMTNSFRDGLLQGGYVLPYEDLSSPFLHISMITAMYAALNGGYFDWAPNTHHVVVLMDSAAPRDPSYPENLCVSSMAEVELDYQSWAGCIAPTCEPAYDFPSGYSPTCEGWIHSQDGNPQDSIAALAHNGPDCADSVGHECTVDVINLFDTPTDPQSQGWPAGKNQGPGTPNVEKDTTNILLAGCDMAAATGGSWSGPIFFSCPTGSAGDLQYVSHGPVLTPNTWNPTLMKAFESISFGPIFNPIVAVGTHQPMFTFVPFGRIAVAWDPDWETACQTPAGFSPNCQVAPSIVKSAGQLTYGWNWSTNATLNYMDSGDIWTLSFNVVSTGPPYQTVPVDACTTVSCVSGGSGSLFGAATVAIYSVPNESGVVDQSFPLTSVLVSLAPNAISPTPPSPLPPVAPPVVAVPVNSPVGNPVLAIVGLTSPLTVFSAQPLAAGMLGAVVTRVMMRNKEIAMAMAVKQSGQKGSKFDRSPMKDNLPGIGKME